MALNLDTQQVVNETITSLKINSFAVDLDRKAIHVAYSELAGEKVIAEKGITIVEPDFTNTIVDASVIAGTDVYAPLKASLYKQIQAVTLITGVVV